MRDAFFKLNFLNARGILAQKNHIMRAIFCQFYDVKKEEQSQQPNILGQLVSGEPERTGISRPKENQSYLAMYKFIQCNITFRSFLCL